MSALFSYSVRVLFLCALLAACVVWSGERVRAQAPLAPPIGLEVVGELRPGTPNIPLLLVVQWDPVDGAESYELERAEPAATPAARVFAPVASIVPPSDQLPGAKVRYVDESGFAAAGGDCFRVRAVSGTEVSDWAEVCLPVPPSSGGADIPDLFQFDIRFSHDYEFTIIQRVVPAGYEDEPFTLIKQGADGPVVVLPPLGRTGLQQIVLLQTSGCWWLEVDDVPPVEYRCSPAPTDLPNTKLTAELLPLLAPVGVHLTGREEAPLAVVWRASGGSQDMRFRIDRVVNGVATPVAFLSYGGSRLSGDVQLFLDPAPLDHPLGCYRVSAVTGAMDLLLGEACLGDSPGPPDVGGGLARGSRTGGGWMFSGVVLLVIAGSLLHRPAR